MTGRGSAITLRALSGQPLADETTERTVRATAHAIAERTGVNVFSIDTDVDAITVRLDCPRLASVGFAAELRRLTERWYAGRHDGASLWGEPEGP